MKLNKLLCSHFDLSVQALHDLLCLACIHVLVEKFVFSLICGIYE